MKTSEVFKVALTYLWDGKYTQKENDKEKYICFCLEAATYHYFFDLDKHLVIIDNLLEGVGCLENWLLWNHGIIVNQSKRNSIKMQKTRKQWLEHLIKHYESIGD